MSNTIPPAPFRAKHARLSAPKSERIDYELRRRRVAYLKDLIGRLAYTTTVGERLAKQWGLTYQTILLMARDAYEELWGEVCEPKKVQVDVGVAVSTGVREAVRKKQWNNVKGLSEVWLKVAGVGQRQEPSVAVNFQQTFQAVGELAPGTKFSNPAMKAMFAGANPEPPKQVVEVEAEEVDD